jgi:RNA polymerase sigma factor (sigma-70 family)
MKEHFETTQWSMVLAAGMPNAGGRAALAELCELYWYPVYAFIRRRRGGSHDLALDLTQEFFAEQIEAAQFGLLDPERGRFRSWLLTRVKSCLSKDAARNKAKKRDYRKLLWIDGLEAAERYALEPRHSLDPERIYECNWSYTLLERSLAQLRQARARRGDLHVLEQVQGLLMGPEVEEPDYALHAKVLDMKPASLRVKVLRLRRAFHAIVRAQTAATVESSEAIDAELEHLLRSLGAAEN